MLFFKITNNKSKKDSLLNLVINSGDKLKDIHVLRAKATWQNLKCKSKKLYWELLKKGLGYAIFRKNLYIVPLDGRKIEDINNNEISVFFNKPLDFKTDVIPNFDNIHFWLGVGLITVRSGLRYELEKKFGENKKIRITRLTIYDPANVLSSNLTTNVIWGLSLDRIIKVNKYNIGIFLHVNYDVIDGSGKPVEDPAMRSRILNAVTARISNEKYKKLLEQEVSRTFPIKIKLSNLSLLFGKKEPIRRERRLDEWFPKKN